VLDLYTLFFLYTLIAYWTVNCSVRPLLSSISELLELQYSLIALSALHQHTSCGNRSTATARACNVLITDTAATYHYTHTCSQICASYAKDECQLRVTIKLPSAYPLRGVEVSCDKKLGISDARWRRWVLQIVTLLSVRDGSVLDAVLLWKRNVDKVSTCLVLCSMRCAVY
jgi:hypothetical protein